MIAGLKPYPAMKPAGVEWLGDVPEHWEVSGGSGPRIARCASMATWTGSDPKEDEDLPTGTCFADYGDLSTQNAIRYFVRHRCAFRSRQANGESQHEIVRLVTSDRG